MSEKGAGGIHQKIRLVMGKVSNIPKRGKNDRFGYHYATAEDIAGACNKAMAEVGLTFRMEMRRPEQFNVEKVDQRSGEVEITPILLVPFTYFFADADTGETISGEFWGSATPRDDKAVYAATTGAMKYILRTALMLETGDGDDPEAVDEAVPTAKPAPPRPAPKPAAPAAPTAGPTMPGVKVCGRCNNPVGGKRTFVAKYEGEDYGVGDLIHLCEKCQTAGGKPTYTPVVVALPKHIEKAVAPKPKPRVVAEPPPLPEEDDPLPF